MQRSGQSIALIVAVGGLVGVGLSSPAWMAACLLGLAAFVVAAWTLPALRARQHPGSPQVAEIRASRREDATAAGTRRAIGYVLLEPGIAELGPRSDVIQRWCETSGLRLCGVVHDTEAAGEHRARPSLQWALAQIAADDADTLVVTRLVDLSPSVATLSPLLRWFVVDGRALVVLDLELDTLTPEGRLAADAVANVGGWEREQIAVRTRNGLAAARSRGASVGRAAVADKPELHRRIARMRDDGMTLQAIADVLNAEGVPTLRGGTMWRPSSVQRATGYQRPTSAGDLPPGLAAHHRSSA